MEAFFVSAAVVAVAEIGDKTQLLALMLAARYRKPIPIILVSAYHDADLLERARYEHILAYLVKPIKQADLEAAITVAMQRFEEFRALRKEAGELRGALEDRKVIERAKGILMKKTGLDEHEVFRRLQKLSRDQNQKMVEVARMILRAEEAFGSG